jgi:hypothetical protein
MTGRTNDAQIRASREKADAQRLLAHMRCWLLRAKLIVGGIEETGIHLAAGVVTMTGAHQILSDLAVDADELAAELAGGDEILPEMGSR